MKKIFTFFIALCGMTCAANAQSFEFQMDGKSLPDGSTITIEAGMNDWGAVECNTNPSTNPNLVMFKKLTTDDSVSEGSATIEIQENTMEAEIISWCMGGNCVPIMRPTCKKNFTFVSTDLYPVVDNAIKLSYDCEPAHFGEMLTKMVATIGGQDYTLFIKFTYSDPANISGVSEDKATAVGYYTVGGQQLQAPQKGLNIVKLSNGKTIKQIIKK